MAKRKNRYQRRSKKKHFLSGMNAGLKTRGSIKNTALETGKDVLIGVLGGGLIGAAIGKPSLLVGILTTGAGHFTGNKLVQILGIGLMAGGGFQKATAVSGVEGLEGIKERIKAYKDSLSDKFYFDKIIGRKTGANGIGELQYFTYPDTMGELAALNDIEQQIAESAMQFQGGGDEDFQIGMLEGSII